MARRAVPLPPSPCWARAQEERLSVLLLRPTIWTSVYIRQRSLLSVLALVTGVCKTPPTEPDLAHGLFVRPVLSERLHGFKRVLKIARKIVVHDVGKSYQI